MLDGVVAGWESYEDAVADYPASRSPTSARALHALLVGHHRPAQGHPPPLELGPGRGVAALDRLRVYGFGDADVFLSPAPLYHSAPLAFSMAIQRRRHGRRDGALRRRGGAGAIERYRVTHGQWVPTMFVRMLKLPRGGARAATTCRPCGRAIHAAAPCPVAVKQEMIEWWGPIIYEYYSATEGIGATFIEPEEWLAHPGSVGKPLLGRDPHPRRRRPRAPDRRARAALLRADELGFEYHNDPAEDGARRSNAQGWATVGDVGYVDDDGYLYLTDRKSLMIISGGVNIYPQEAENLLVTHPKVLDVAVFGVPDDDMGEQVKAVVQPADWADAGPELERELLEYCRGGPRALQVPAHRRLRARAAPPRHRQALQAPAARPLLAGVDQRGPGVASHDGRLGDDLLTGDRRRNARARGGDVRRGALRAPEPASNRTPVDGRDQAGARPVATDGPTGESGLPRRPLDQGRRRAHGGRHH